MKMELLQGNRRRAMERPFSPKPGMVEKTREMGLTGWIWELWSTLRANYLRGQLRSQMRSARQMQVIETMGLGGRRQVVLIRCGSERFLVGCGPDQVHTMLRLAACDEEPASPAASVKDA